jgi:hypothetical protein
VKQYLEYIQSLAVIILVLSAIGGISYHLFRHGGWIETAIGTAWDAGVRYPLIAVPVILGAFVLGKMWRDNRLAHGYQSRLPDYLIYVLMAAGAYYIGHFFVRGTF